MKRDQVRDNELAGMYNRDMCSVARSEIAAELYEHNEALAYIQYRKRSYGFSIDELKSLLYEVIYDKTWSYRADTGVDYYLWLSTAYWSHCQARYRYGCSDASPIVHVPVMQRTSHGGTYEVHTSSMDTEYDDGTTLADTLGIDDTNISDWEHRDEIRVIRKQMAKRYDMDVYGDTIDKLLAGLPISRNMWHQRKRVLPYLKQIMSTRKYLG